MNDLKYDPELPFAVGHDHSEDVTARFSNRDDAIYLAREYKGMWVIDTTPKPKIPEDAEFIMWWAPETQRFAWRVPLGWKYWEVSASLLGDQETLESEIGDAEVTVLVRREDA